jgi:hypothetical protein
MLIRQVMVELKVRIIIKIMCDSIYYYYYLLQYRIKNTLWIFFLIFISLENNILIVINLFVFFSDNGENICVGGKGHFILPLPLSLSPFLVSTIKHSIQ